MNETLITLFTHYGNVFLSVLLLLVILYTIYLHKKLHHFTRGANASSLEEIIKSCVEGVAKIEEKNEFISKHALILEERVSHAIRNAHVARYKAFETNGSNQSFSVALVNERGNGVVISTLHAHDRISTFAKPIENYKSSYELTEEERSVLDEAKESHKATSRVSEEE